MFITRKHLSRRTLLKGTGVTLALPFLEAMVPAATALARTAAAPKMRAGFFYIPHGAVQGDTLFGLDGDRWTPSGSGANFKLNTITAPLEPFKKYVSLIGNLNNPNGSGVHTRNTGTWLSCSGSASTTIDQLIARKIGQDTEVPSLQLSSETTVQQAAGNGATLAATLAFRDANTPLQAEYNPKKIFDLLFGTGDARDLSRHQQEDSLLDLIKESTTALQRELGAGDKAVLEDYLDNVRVAEQRVLERKAAAEKLSKLSVPERPPGVDPNFDKQVELVFNLLAIAYQADLTRVASYIMVAEGTNQTYNHIGVPDSFHPISHHANQQRNIDPLVKIQTWHMAAFAQFLKKMSETPDGDGTLLDHSIFLYGSNMGNSDKHSSTLIPTVVIGGGNGKMKLGGQHIALPQPTPLANVHLTLLNKFGIEQDKFADSTGMISEL